MSERKKQKDLKEHRTALLETQKRLHKLQSDKRGDGRGYSLEGLRLASLLGQMQALQAIQGLKELRPGDKKRKGRFEFSPNAAERATQRQWLAFKADWLNALLEDTLSELEALDEYENSGEGQGVGARGEGQGASE